MPRCVCRFLNRCRKALGKFRLRSLQIEERSRVTSTEKTAIHDADFQYDRVPRQRNC